MKATKIFTLALVILGFSTASFAQNPTASATATASGTIITPISIVKTGDLSFGNIIADADGGKVTVATDGSVSRDGVNAPAGVAGTISAASFTVSGFDGAAYTISLPSSIELTSGSNKMTVNSFVSNPAGTGSLKGGSQTVAVGATLNVAANQAAGTYTNSSDLKVTVNYN